MLNFCDFFFSLIIIRIFIKNVIIRHLKQLNLSINNEKQLNLRDLDLLLLLTLISVILIVLVLFGVFIQVYNRFWLFSLICWVLFLFRCSRSFFDVLYLLFLATFGLNFNYHVVEVPFLLRCNISACFFFLNYKF